MRSLFLLVPFFFTACGFELEEKSSGELGKLTFEYSASQCPLFGCSLDRPALQGSMVTVFAEGDRKASRPVDARLPNETFGKITRRKVDCDTSPKCRMEIDIELDGAAGDAPLEIIGGDAKVLDKIALHIKPAARIDVVVRATSRQAAGEAVTRDVAPALDGVFEIRRTDFVAFQSDVFSAENERMIFTKHGVSHAYADETVLKAATGPSFMGRTDVESMTPGRTGETFVTVKARGAEANARFRIVL